VYRTVTSRRRRIATAALWFLTVLSGTDVVGASGDLSWIHVFAALTAAFLYADPFHRVWPRRRVTIADLPRLQGDLPVELPDALREVVRAR
jgi:hypothetical protein